MTYFDNFRNRMLANGNNVRDDYTNSTINVVNESFADSPSFKVVTINGVSIDTRLVTTGVSSDRLDILFRPNSSFKRGDFVNIDNEDWLITDFFPSEIYPKAKSEKCNQTMNWKDSLGNTYSQPCAVKIDILYLEEEKFLTIPDGTIYVLTQFNADSDKILVGDRFIFGDKSFEVITIDDFTKVSSDSSLMKINMKRVEVSDNDDVVNNISTKPSSLGSRWK